MAGLQSVSMTYEPFSKEPEYIECNRGFVGRMPLERVDRFLDVACGTGTVSELLLEGHPEAHLNGVDYDPVQIELATETWEELGHTVRPGFEVTDDVANGKPVVVLGVGSGDELPFADETFDCVTIANAIHMMPDTPKFLAAVHRVLKPAGVFGFNSGFYAGCYPEGTERHMYQWLREATHYIEDWNKCLAAEGKQPIRRQHGTARSAFQNRWLSAEEWSDQLAKHGFEAIDVHERTILMDLRCLQALVAYGGLVEVVMSGYPVEAASIALQSTAPRALKLLGVRALPRKWLEMWVRKKSSQ